MEKERKIKVLSLVALIVAVLGLTVAFAALSQTLTINGTASVNAAEWDVHFENLDNEASAYGNASVNKEPVIEGNNITFAATLTKPEDQVWFYVDLVNNGTINAEISSVEISKLCTLQSSIESCDWNNDGVVTQEDIEKVNDNLSFIVYYQDNLAALKEKNKLNVNERRTICVSLSYQKEILSGPNKDHIISPATELPKRNLTFNDLSVTINYVQAD